MQVWVRTFIFVYLYVCPQKSHHLVGEAVPPVWVLNLKKITPKVRHRMRELMHKHAMMFNGRLVIPCACVAGGSSGGVDKDNISAVQMEFERYLDGTEYDLNGGGERKSDAEWTKIRQSSDTRTMYQWTDWHGSRTNLDFLVSQRSRKHLMAGYIPNVTLKMQPADVHGFDKIKDDVADQRVTHIQIHSHCHSHPST